MVVMVVVRLALKMKMGDLSLLPCPPLPPLPHSLSQPTTHTKGTLESSGPI